MNVFKKIFAVIIIVFAAILSMAILVTIKNTIIDTTKVIDEEGQSNGIAYLVGSGVAIIIFIFLAKYLFKVGFKILKAKEPVLDSIEEIGKVE